MNCNNKSKLTLSATMLEMQPTFPFECSWNVSLLDRHTMADSMAAAADYVFCLIILLWTVVVGNFLYSGGYQESNFNISRGRGGNEEYFHFLLFCLATSVGLWYKIYIWKKKITKKQWSAFYSVPSEWQWQIIGVICTT